MLYPAEFKHCYAVQKADVVPFVTTIGGMIAFGLAEGIGIGCVSAVALNKYITLETFGKMKVSSEESSSSVVVDAPKSIVWKVDGPINFVSMFEIDELMKKIRTSKAGDDSPIVLDMQGVTSL